MQVEEPIKITEAAKAAIEDPLRANKIPDSYGLRVGVKGGGCGATLLLGFDEPSSFDQLYQVAGVKVLIDRRHLMYVLGVEVGHQDGPDGSGFTVG